MPHAPACTPYAISSRFEAIHGYHANFADARLNEISSEPAIPSSAPPHSMISVYGASTIACSYPLTGPTSRNAGTARSKPLSVSGSSGSMT